MGFYFDKYEKKKPPEPVPYSIPRELLWQFLAVINLVLGLWYIVWRWGYSINYNALWFSIPLIVAESCAFFGLMLFTFNLWKTKDFPQLNPPEFITECTNDPNIERRPIKVDVFFPTYDEDPELVRLSIIDAKKIRYPHPIDIKIYVLDDGRRETMRKVAEEEGVYYITRENNIGFKAGNLRNAMEQTSGDFIVICDADTRPFPTILEHTLGYFRDPDVAWVQTPQWFFDLPEGTPLPFKLKRYIGKPGYFIGKAIEKLVGPVNVGEDPFCNNPQMFYDVIQRRRNWANASFCCGAGSIHRREAVMEVALKTYADAVDGFVKKFTKEIKDEEIRISLEEEMKRQIALETEITPYKFHVSEDIYTSIVLHSDPDRNWKSVLHPPIESKMLSPQDLLSWVIQRFKYAGGTLDIALHDNPILKKGLSIPQKLMYGTTIWSYLGCLWNVVFLVSPIIYLFTGIAPVSAYSMEFFKHIFPFLLANEIAFMVGTWGISAWGGQSFYLAFFPINLKALWTVIRGKKISFPVPQKIRQEGNFFRLVLPQFTIIILTALGLIFAITKYFLGFKTNLPGVVTNLFWGINNIWALSGIVRAAFWQPED
ncbi:MAG: glycosyltransferase [Deltaproteobacteria bacterium]|nr:glycosyltransferase [Deltaproteobacteria bacterium]